MDENVVSFYYQWYRLLIFYTCFFFFSIPYQSIEWVRFSLVKESTYFRGTEVWRKYYPMQFVLCSCCVKIETKTAVYETKDEILFLLPG